MQNFLRLSTELQPLFLAATSFGIIVLAFAVYHSNRKSATNIIFSLLSLSILLWIWSAYVAGLTIVASYAIIFHRLGIFFAAPMSTLFFLLAYTMPNPELPMRRRTVWAIVIITALMMAINLSPYAFIGTDTLNNPIAGPGLLPFGILSSIFSLLAVYYLFKRYITTKKPERVQFGIVLIGIFTMLLLVISTILIPIVVFKSGAFLPYLSIYTIIFLALTAYAITKYQLFNINVILTQSVTVVIIITLFSKIFVASSLLERGADTIIFLITVLFSISLIKSVRNEIHQRERIEKLAEDLKIANKRLTELDQMKSEFVSLATHQIRAPLTAIKGYVSLIQEGDYGPISPDIAKGLTVIMDSTNNLVTIVGDFLDVSRIEQGRMKFDFSDFSMEKLAEEVVEEYRPNIEKRGLQLNYSYDHDAQYDVHADRGKVKQVIGNILDNSIKYTPHGEIDVNVRNPDGKILITISDTGVGINPKTLPKLFQKFTRADNANETNILGTGLGLYVAKNMIESMNGRVWAGSDGEGKGARFYIELQGKK